MSTTPKPTVTPELRSAVEDYLLAKANVDTLRPTILALRAEALQARPVHVAAEWLDRERMDVRRICDAELRIIDTEHLYLGDDDECAVYYEYLHELFLARGFKDLPEVGYCPLCMAETLQLEAERAVIGAAGYLTARDGNVVTVDMLLCQRNGLEKYHQYIDLVVRLVLALVPHINAKSLMADFRQNVGVA